MSRWFITGGSGFVGRNLIRDRISRGDAVIALGRSDRALETLEYLGAQAVRGNLDLSLIHI